ncbi:MAG: methyltransferase domain-containing protein [Candidatus Taylorbacteria bacterium]|nr:methyltransferase domain-containing protein [Candidatus Taylorbacteria bacterium]
MSLLFLKRAIRNRKYVGAVAPSSRRLSRLMIESANLASSKNIVELGPGTGVFTREILNKKNSEVFYLGIELDKSFVNLLKKNFPTSYIEHGSAEEIDKHLAKYNRTSCDRVISGLPWTSFDKKYQEALLKKIHDSLEEGGMFLTFSYFPFNHLPKGNSFKKLLYNYFSEVKMTKVVRNTPPAFVYICKK